jgi:hypothetical protein
MRGDRLQKLFRISSVAGVLLLGAGGLAAQTTPEPRSQSLPPASDPNVKALADSVRALQGQVQSLAAELAQLRSEEQRDRAEARELRQVLELARAEGRPGMRSAGSHDPYAGLPPRANNSLPSPDPPGAAAPPPQQDQSTEARLIRLEENQQLADARIAEQSQTKVESGSKYRVRLSGIVLFNLFDNEGVVDNEDFPQIATPRSLGDSTHSFGGSLRQSQIGLEVFGPGLAGARTSANVKFDFAGGFTDVPNGTAMGIVRLRTGTFRMDWENTSIVAGQDYLFFAPLTPTSLASLAVPALSYSGNLWAWTPQVRVEHKISLSDDSHLLLQAGILDSLSGELPAGPANSPSWGEQSGQPAYAGRIAWSRRVFERDFTVGVGGYYARQNFGLGRSVNGWATTIDALLPLGKYFGLSGEFYRGSAVAGIGGGIGQSILVSGDFTDATATIKGLDSMGGWVQLKFKPRANFEINGAFGQDNPFAGELRRFPGSPSYFGGALTRNLTPFVNFIYQPRSDVLFSVEYRRLQTYTLDSGASTANHIAASVGYIF